MEEFHRPNLCRLCQFPVVDGGVQLSREELDKVSDWLKQKVGECLCISKKEEEEETSWWICQFCSWDARFMDENSEENAEERFVWWPQENDKNFEDYYKADLLKPCFVKMGENLEHGEDPNITTEIIDLAIIAAYDSDNGPADFESTSTLDNLEHEEDPKITTESDLVINTTCDSENGPADCELSTTSDSSESTSKSPGSTSDSSKSTSDSSESASDSFESSGEESSDRSEPAKSKNSRINCIYCDDSFEKKLYLSKHVNRVHRDEAIKCTYLCTTYFKTKEDRTEHIANIHEAGAGVRTCIYCNEKTKCISRHMKINHKKIAIRCSKPRCASYFRTLKEKETHFNQFHVERDGKGFQCLFCDTSCKTFKLLENHTTYKHNENVVKCMVFMCYNYFKTQSEADDHLKQSHPEIWGKKIYSCPSCNYKTVQESFIRQHTLMAHSSEQFDCFYCGKIFKTKKTIKRHLVGLHIGRKSCPHCQMLAADLKLHVRKRKCQFCSKEFPCIGSRQKHGSQCRTTHKCSLCPKQFKMPHQLNYHMKWKHNSNKVWKGLEHKDKGFKCDLCRKYFISRAVRNKHNVRSHWNQKLNCDLCKSTCGSKSAIIRHLDRKHHDFIWGKEEFVCLKYPKIKLKCKMDLNNHWIHTHGVKPQKRLVECKKCGKIMLAGSVFDRHNMYFH